VTPINRMTPEEQKSVTDRSSTTTGRRTLSVSFRKALFALFRFPRKRRLKDRAASLGGDPGLDYWRRRVEAYGRRAAVHLGHPESEYDALRDTQWAQIAPWLRREVRPEEKLAVDFGCGPGRFTKDLAGLLNGRAIGVDPMETLLRLAPTDPGVQYVVIPEGQIPLSSRSVDVLWSCLVLGGIQAEPLKQTLAEMDRVLRKDGLLFLVENTSRRPSAHYWTFRSTSEYQRLCTFAELRHLHTFEDLGEQISIMAGRKR
jgi:SAM-dependent methyltransferase